MGALIEWGAAERPFPGETESGDGFLVKSIPEGVLVAVVDGLGHGRDAAAASEIAVATLEAHAHEEIIPLVNRCHKALKRTHGVVMSLASFNTSQSMMTWLGVGNIEGMLLRAGRSSPRETLLLRGGVVGFQLPPLRASRLPVEVGDRLIFATDGIRSGFAEELFRKASSLWEETPRRIADHILARFGKTTDDALVLVAHYLGAGP